MSEPDDTPAVPAILKRSTLPKAITAVAVAILVLLLGVALTTRYGVLIPQVRLLIEARTDGLKIGSLGRLKIEGLSGDVWRDARVRRLTIRDEKGVWLEANNVRLTWRYAQLLRRTFDADLIEAQTLRLIRRPTLGPKGKSGGLPLSFHIDQARTRVILEPGFSDTRGVYDLAFSLQQERRGGSSGKVKAASVLHPGDHLNLEFAFGGQGALKLMADAEEARGGALAGAIGLPADRPFRLQVRADGQMSAGRFVADATSGNNRPLSARGAWTPAGGEAGGRVQLAASKLTAPLAERLGPEVRFGLAGRKVSSGVYALDARVLSDAVVAHAWGPGDLGKRRLSPQGVQLDAQAASLSRITGGPKMGAARLQGRLTGEAAAWRFAGSTAVNGIDLGDYSLDRVGGPVVLVRTKAGFEVDAKLAAAGGRGAGFAAALLGGAPTAALEAARLENGQLLVRRLDVTGRGLKVAASGGRSLLGAVNVKGDATFSNLAAARIGAGGGATVGFQASQARDAAPWTVILDARGDRFALGVAEVDRMLGPKPRIQVQASWDAGRLSVAKATLDGAAVTASAAGVMERDQKLAFKADWSASGPFRAGPVEITGRAKGTGGVSGTVAAPRMDLVADFEQVDVPRLPLRDARLALTFQRQADGSLGTVAMTATSAYGPARARSDFRFPAGGADLTGLSLDAGGLKLAGSLSLRRNSPSAADLQVEVAKGAFLDAGRVTGQLRIQDAAGGPQVGLVLRGQGLQLAGAQVAVRNLQLSADGPLARLPYVLNVRGASTRGAWNAQGQGVFAEAEPGYSLTFDGMGRLAGQELRTAEPAVLRFGGPASSARLRLATQDGGQIDLDGTLRDEAADVQARIARVGLNLFEPDLTGRLDATLALKGAGERLEGTAEAKIANARARGAPAKLGIDATLQARLTDATLTIDATTGNESGLRGNANFVLPAESSAAPFRVAIARQKPMRGRFFAEGEVGPLWDLLIGGERSLAGFVHTEGMVGGTLADPRASGSIAVDRGRFDDGGTGLSLRDVVLRAAFNQDSVNVTEARGEDGRGGQLSGEGRISLLREGVSGFRLALKNFRVIDNETATATASGEASINRAADGKVKLTGDLTIDRADVAADPPIPSGVVAMDVKEINRPDELQATLAPTVKRGDGWAMDVKLRAPRRVFLRGRGLDLELSLDAHVGGTTANPDLTGQARVVRGDYDFAGKRFEFDDRSVVYLSTRPQNIRLQLDATREDPSLTVTVRIRGTAARPEITLTSSPSLPNDEVLAKVLFERSASQLSPVEAAQLASALSALAGGGGLDVVGNLRSFAGLDRLAFGGGDESGVTVSGGKYLTDDVYLELTGGGREGPSAQVEWRIRKNLSILSKLAGEAGNRLAIRWRKDY